MPDVLRPAAPADTPPGTIVSPEGGLPFKVRWTKGQLERDCNNWDGNPNHMHWETIDPADIGLPSTDVTWNSVRYHVVAGVENRVPNVISAQLRQSRRETQRIFQGASVGSVLAPEEAGVS